MIKCNKADFFVLQNEFSRCITEFSCICALVQKPAVGISLSLQTGMCQLKLSVTRHAFHLGRTKGSAVGCWHRGGTTVISLWGNSDTNPLENPVYGTISSENLFSGTVIFQSCL